MRITVTISDLEYHEYRFWIDGDSIKLQAMQVWKRTTKRNDHRLDKSVSWSSLSYEKFRSEARTNR